MADLEDMVCPNHPSRQAVARCRACMKPVCAQCAVEVQSETFCSKDCANNHFVTEAHMDNLRAREAARRRRRLIQRVLTLLIFLAVLGGAWATWSFVLSEETRQQVLEKFGYSQPVRQ